MAKTVNQINQIKQAKQAKQVRRRRFSRKALVNSIDSISKGKLLCPFCQSSKLVRRGTNKNKSEQKQKYFCANCIKYTVNPISKNS